MLGMVNLISFETVSVVWDLIIEVFVCNISTINAYTIYFSNDLLLITKFLRELTLKPQKEKEEFFR